VTELLTLEAAAVRSGEPVGRIRQWCITGALHCDRVGGSWTLSETELERVPALAASPQRPPPDRHVVALALPGPADPKSLAKEIAQRLSVRSEAVMVRTLAFEQRDWVIAAWPERHDPAGFERLAELADELGGELIERGSGWRTRRRPEPGPALGAEQVPSG
jgi:hypothetical protein